MTDAYRRSVPVDGDAYWHVEMGRRDRINGPSSYPFPSEYAAFRFAASHKRRDPHRDVAVRYPDGQTVDITLTDLGDPHDDDA